ncbi:hypothetical protein LIER_14895 [Lithospermum erythrorhizon]|uniref:Uncharacterized protein n=1 Tax=Lithospermum erythrorhizon TaxID=34254 RepID=A0AAV3Q2P8_LITER
MEKEEKSRETEKAEFLLQWGNKKRLRCGRVRGSSTDLSDQSNIIDGNKTTTSTTTSSRIRRKTFLKEPVFPHPSSRLNRNAETMSNRSENGKSTSTSPERHYTTRGSIVGLDEIGKIPVVDGVAGNHHFGNANNCSNSNTNSHNGNTNNNGTNSRGLVWPKIYVTLSSKEKEEDFLAMKGCKLPQRPKKRAKVVQRTLLMVSPGAWLAEVTRERYEVKEKKNSKKKPRGLKAMGGIESESE